MRVEPSKAGSGLFALLPQVRVVLTKYNHILTLSFPSPRINLQDPKQLPQSGKKTHKQLCFFNLCLVDSLGNATVLILTYIIHSYQMNRINGRLFQTHARCCNLKQTSVDNNWGKQPQTKRCQNGEIDTLRDK